MFRVLSTVAAGTAIVGAANTPTYQYDNDPAPTSVTQIELFCDYKPEGSKFTWEDLQNDINPLDDVKVEIPCKVNIIDDVDGGMRNCMVKQRGTASRYADIKSYTIKFDDKTQTWRGLDRLLLKKDSGDKSHLRSKVVFDTFKKMDLSIWETFRTHFTHLEVQLKDESGNVDIEDMGIYTNFEKGNEDWIETRHKDGSGDFWIYKAEYYDFDYEDRLKESTDPRYHEDEFEEVLEIEASKDSRKIINTMKEINAASDADFPSTLTKHFDMDNLVEYIAVTYGILGDWDHRGNNVYFFSNADSGKWMFYPWDYDKSLRRVSKHNKVSVGMSVMHDNYLFRRIMYLMPKDFTSKVTQRIKTLTAEGAPWSKEALEEMTDSYSKAVDPYLASGKVDNVKLNKKQWSSQKAHFFQCLEENPKFWEEMLEVPTSVYWSNTKPNDLGDGQYKYRIRPVQSPDGLDVLHRATIFTEGPGTDNSEYYAEPEGVLFNSDWIELAPNNGVSEEFIFTVPQDVRDKCGSDGGCYINVVGKDSEGNVGYYGKMGQAFVV